MFNPLSESLGIKQEKFCQAYLETNGNGSMAVKEAGYNPGTNHAAAVHANKLLTSSDIQSRIRQLASDVGLTIGSCLETIRRKLDAKKPIVIGKEIQLFDDNQAQLRAAELGLKVHGIAMSGETSNITNNLLSLTQYTGLATQHHDKKP